MYGYGLGTVNVKICESGHISATAFIDVVPLIFETIQGRGKRDGGSEDQVSDLEHGDAVPVITVHA